MGGGGDGERTKQRLEKRERRGGVGETEIERDIGGGEGEREMGEEEIETGVEKEIEREGDAR